MVRLFGKGVEAMVIDFGALTQKNQDAFFRCSRCFLVGSVSGWQLADFAALAAKSKNGKNGVSISSHLEKRKL